jgi:hypothetical protein
MAGTAIPCCAHQPVHSVWSLGSKQFIHIAFAISDPYQLGLCTARLQRRQMGKTLDPLSAFFLVDGSGLALRSTTFGCFSACPRLHAQHPKRQPLWTDCQQAVHQETTLIATGTVT